MKIYAIATLAALSALCSADVITRWNFNGESNTTVPGGGSSPTPEVGTGVASLLGTTTGAFNSGVSNGGSSDPITTSPPNYGWQTTPYTAQSTGEGTSGVQFMVSTAGYQNITVTFDTRHSNTSSKWVRLDYTLNGGTTWIPGTAAAGTIYEATAGDTWYNLRSANLASVSGANNNPNFGIRMVTVYGPQNGPFVDGFPYTQYWSSNPASSYATTGTLRWDMVTINGDVANQNIILTNVAVTMGQPLGGNLASLTASDNNRYQILCDEFDSTGEVIVTASSPNLNPTTINGTFETRAGRTDLSQFTRIYNYSTNAYDAVDFRNSSLTDVTYTAAIPGANHVSGSGEIRIKFLWIPQGDVDAADGWSMGIDYVNLTL